MMDEIYKKIKINKLALIATLWKVTKHEIRICL